MNNLLAESFINVNNLKVTLDPCGSSPYPQQAIWQAQHICVAEDFSKATLPDESKCGQIIVQHQLKVAHYSVLEHAFVRFNCLNFNHDTVMQLRTHSASSMLVQSGRYTGKRFIAVADGELPVETTFWFKPEGEHTDRNGAKYYYGDKDIEDDEDDCSFACERYAEKIKKGYSEEHARNCLPQNIKQAFCLAANLKDLFHVIDQRSLADAQVEAQVWSYMVMQLLLEYCPEIADWYLKNRYTKARLAP